MLVTKLLYHQIREDREREFCKDLGGYLAEITSVDENKGIINYLEAKNPTVKSVWLGGTDILHDGTWFWMHSKDPITFSAWVSGQPDNFHGENCIHLNRYGSGTWGWNDYDCKTKLYGLCETDLQGPEFG
ncbi:perlucin-like protein isoform X2 [Gigantopelta aegis]|uniref:perlucin-like protein isoform X2 n=1 Tax=Gigantopelta aegis TaxID=1735272 RepID=UPI001B889101|nr:perlucin-like protein isoform X2 [Gigantopelta aegis]